MQWDFWNNPIIVSAFRVRYRRGGMWNVTTMYLLLLTAGGMLLYYYRDRFSIPWPKLYFACILGVQFFACFMLGLTATGTSMRSEVVNRTLDFQRLASLSPAKILLGKLLGEPAMAFLLSIASFPFAVYCALVMGVVSLGTLLLLYLNLGTSLLLICAVGLIQPLELSASKSPSGFSGQNASWGGVALVFMLFAGMGATSMLSTPWTAALIGLATPLAPYFGLILFDDPWHYQLVFYTWDIPFLLVTPVTQLLLTFLCFHVMVRRLINPLNPSISKGMSYLILLAVDLMIGAVLGESEALGLKFVKRCGVFCLIHLLGSLWLTIGCTPWRESLLSWMWRYRGRTPWPRDLWLGARSPNGLAVVTFGILGIVSLIVCVVLPYGMLEGRDSLRADGKLIDGLFVLLVSTIVLLTYGLLYQLCVAVAGKSGRMIWGTLLLLLNIPTHVVGYRFNLNILLELSPSAQVAAWFQGGELLNSGPLLALYGAGLALMGYALSRYMTGMESIIERKLRGMGAAIS
jgi:hypothetical protein